MLRMAAARKKSQKAKRKPKTNLLSKTETESQRILQIRGQIQQRKENRGEKTQKRMDRCRRGLPDRVKKFFERYFDRWDDDGNGLLDRTELRTILADFEYRITDRELSTLLEIFDADGSDGIDKEEFITMMAVALQPNHTVEKLRDAFVLLNPERNKFCFPQDKYAQAFSNLLPDRSDEEPQYYWSANALVDGLARVFFGSNKSLRSYPFKAGLRASYPF